jgi:uncharacterized protein with NAD-binding domain and iron-sulfur cluster
MKKIAILGGGIGSLAAAHKLTQQPDWKNRFDITVYQMGWRLGGKGASSRNQAFGDRIEEHGLHVWAGFYENAFALMRAAYAARPPCGSPIQTVEDAFIPESHVILADNSSGKWEPWNLYFPPQPGQPGDGNPAPLPNIMGYIKYMLDWLLSLHEQLPAAMRAAVPLPDLSSLPESVQALLPQPVAAAPAAALHPAAPDAVAAFALPPGGAHPVGPLHASHAIGLAAFAGQIEEDIAADAIGFLLEAFKLTCDPLHDLIDDCGTEARRLAISVDLLVTVLLCVVKEGVLRDGFEALDKYELTEILRIHGAWPETLACPMVVSAYDYIFSYLGGDRSKPSISACSAFQGFLRLLGTYKGALFYKMAAGAGEIIFSPVYETLAASGVKFAFFNRVMELVPGDGGIKSIRIAVQATTKSGGEYQPLVNIDRLACWPATPLYDQLTNGDALRASGIDLEDTWETYSIGEKVLEAGQDFDAVVLGIPAGALADLTPKLCTPGSKWKTMLDATQTVATQALQLWLDCDLADFGGPFVAPQPDPDTVGPIMTSWAPPFDTWSDMTHLLKHESWPAPAPKNIAYFCGVLKDQPVIPGNDPQPAADLAAYANAVTTCQLLPTVWPNTAGPDGFKWDLLHARNGLVGQARLADQYVRANITGTERYVLSPPNLLETRLPTNFGDYDNLYLAGDWVKVAAINAGCMEVATMAGYAAAAAIAGVPDNTVA